MPTVTRQTIRQDAAKLMGAYLWSGTATGGTATTLVHTGSAGLRDSGMSATYFGGAFVLLTSGGDSGLWRQITPAGYAPTTGTITVGEAWPTGPANGTTYEIYVLFDPAQWNTLIDDALARLRFRTRTPLTLITDGDMETSGTSNWTASSSTVTKLTSGAFVYGTQALEVANTGANGYAQSVNVVCNPSDSFQCWADYRAVSGTAVLVARDITNGTQITTSSGGDAGLNNEGGMINIGFTVASTARNIAIRLQGTQSTADIYWDNVVLMRTGRRRYALPSGITERDMISDFFIRNGNRPNEYRYMPVRPPVFIDEDWSAVNTFTVVLPDGNPIPIILDSNRAFGSLATDTTTTTCPSQLAKYAVATEAYLRLTPEAEAMVNQRNLAVKKAEIFKRFTELQRRHMPPRPRPSSTQYEWASSTNVPFRRWGRY